MVQKAHPALGRIFKRCKFLSILSIFFRGPCLDMQHPLAKRPDEMASNCHAQIYDKVGNDSLHVSHGRSQILLIEPNALSW
jgi:hypothetical protein